MGTGKLAAFIAAAGLLASAAAAQAQAPGDLIGRPLGDAEKAFIGGEVAKHLRDPDSAKFKWAPIETRVGQLPKAYCGMVNAKNSFGGYAGDVPFIAHLKITSSGMTVSGVEILDEEPAYLTPIDLKKAGCVPSHVLGAQ